MSFTAEWTPASGFNTSGYTVTFGKALNQCSVDELLAHPMCGSNNPIGNCAYVTKYDDLGYGSVAMHLLNAQFKEPIPNKQSNTWVCSPAPTGDLAKIYRRTIFVGMPTNVTVPQYCLTDESDSRILIVENIKDPNKLVYNYGNITFSAGATAQYRTCANQIRHTCNKGQSAYSSAPSTVTYEDPDTHTTTVYKICAYQVYVINDDCFICGYDYIGNFLGRYQNENNEYNALSGGSSYTSFKHENGNCLFIGCNINGTGTETNLQGILGNDIYADPVPDPATFVNTNVDYAPTNIELQNVKLRFYMSNSTIGGSLRSCGLNVALYDTEEIRKHQMARAGIYFAVNGELFKPIISGGIVTGYGTPDKVSEIDTYTDLNHPVPSGGGGGGGGGGGYDDDPWHGISFSGVGVGGAGAFAKCYYMTSTELANLRSWMNSNNVPEGFDPMAQIIGLSQVPVSLSGDDNTTVQFVNSSAVYDPGVTRLVDSGVNTQISMGSPKRYSLGSVNITRRMQERGEPYLDYDCQIELYLPLIGMFSLDTQAVMGRTITAEAVLDPISGTLAAYAYVTRDGQNLPIAYGSTTIGVDLPISAQQYSVSRAALKQANAQLGTSLLSSTLSFIAAATAGGKGSGTGAKTATGSTNGLAAAGIREAGADYMKASQAGNVFGDFMQWGRTIRQLSYGNNTAIAGSFGGSTAQWSYPFTPYVKIIRPRYEKPSNYAHSQGVPCVQTKTVGSCTGFIQCIGVDVSGITGATDIELQAIQAALTNGVFAGGGS